LIILKKNQINDLILCQNLFGKNTLSNKYSNTPDNNKIAKFKTVIEQIAKDELKDMMKFKPSEYRVKYTNAYCTKKEDYSFLAEESITLKLNNILSIFADNVFIGYNVPIEIPVAGSDIIYRAMIDFLLVDHNGDVIAIEIDDLTDIEFFKQKMKYWPQYYAPYSFLTDVFKKDIFLTFIDPINFTKLEYQFTGSSLVDDLKDLKSTVSGVSNSFYIKNLSYCTRCNYMGQCD
jgi:hypothetical protein